jgi:predicted TIM-barrel fold metal-dependent hydrolase
MPLTLPTSDPRGIQIEEFDTTKLLSHAAKQARDRHYENMFIVDVDSHHYETEHTAEILDYFEDPVLRQLLKSDGTKSIGVNSMFATSPGFQDMGGRVTRYPLRRIEKTGPGKQRDAELTTRWMDAMGTDIAMLFPTPMLLLSSHPLIETQTALAWAYNRWLTERVLSVEPRLRSMLYLPFHDPEEAYKMVLAFGDTKGVKGFMVTATHNIPVHDNRYMKVYAALEERGLPIAFHGGYNWNDTAFKTTNRFISVHALGFVFYNMVHMTNWVINGLGERFPKLDVIWMESGLAWVPFLMQRLDNEFGMRSNECPQLKMKPSDYMRKMYYSTQPMEIPEDLSILQTTFKMIKADTQLMYSSDYPHWDFDLPSTIYDLPFLDESAKRNILGENARRVFRLEETGKLAKIPGL